MSQKGTHTDTKKGHKKYTKLIKSLDIGCDSNTHNATSLKLSLCDCCMVNKSLGSHTHQQLTYPPHKLHALEWINTIYRVHVVQYVTKSKVGHNEEHLHFFNQLYSCHV